MPKDKTESHNRIKAVAKSEFLEKGFEKASMREIGRKAGMTPAGLYRHYASKEAMFEDLVDPFIAHIRKIALEHEHNAYINFDKTGSADSMMTDNVVRVIKSLMVPYHDELKLILTCAHGTKYENFIHDLVKEETGETLKAFEYIRKSGIDIEEISEDELHVLFSAYITAILEPIVHDWPMDKALRCLDLVEEFFMPSWKQIMGFEKGKENG